MYRNAFIPIEISLGYQFAFTSGIYLLGFIFYQNPKRLRIFLGLVLVGIVMWFVIGMTYRYAIQTSDTGWQVEGVSDQYFEPLKSPFKAQIEPFLGFKEWLVIKGYIPGASEDILNGVTETITTSDLERSDLRLYNYVFLGLMSFLTLILLRTLLKIKYFRILLTLPLVHFIWLWYNYIDIPMSLFQLYILGSLSYIASEQMNMMALESPDYSIKHYKQGRMLIWTTLLSLIMIFSVSLIMIVLPIRKINQAIDPLIPNIWGARSAFDMGGFKMFSLGDTAFQNGDDLLGGPIEDIDENTILFKLDLEEVPLEAIYLRANAKDYYTGSRWESRATTFQSNYENFLSNNQNREAVERLKDDSIYREDHQTFSTGVVTFMGMDSLTIMSPLGLYGTNIDPNRVFTSFDNEAFYKAGAFVKMLDAYRYFSLGQDFSYFDQIDYLQVPDTLEKDLILKAYQITDYKEEDDRKMLALTQYLIDQYTYTLSPPDYTGERDFVSEFFLDTGEGYCTYFASTLVILARINDIPARYVEGFRIDPEEDLKSYLVTEASAHAWAEVYLEDQGWTIWEATPPYVTIEQTVYLPKDQDEIEEDVNETTRGENTGSKEDNLSIKEQMLEAEMQMGGDGQVSQSDGVSPEDSQEEGVDMSLLLKPLLGMFFLLISGVILLNLLAGRPKKTHKALVENIYYLWKLERWLDLHGDDRTEGEFLKILYDDPERIDDQMIARANTLYSQRRQRAYKKYHQRYGLLKYLVFRGVKVRAYHHTLKEFDKNKMYLT